MMFLTDTGRRNLEKIGFVRRAREFHLYTEKGQRYLDFCQAGGQAVLGHRPFDLTRSVKNMLEKGLYAPYPSSVQIRLEKSLLKIFPDYCRVCFFETPEQIEAEMGEIPFLWRPWHPENRMEKNLAVLIPLPGGLNCFPVLTQESSSVRVGRCISPVTAAGAISLLGKWNRKRETGDQSFWNGLTDPQRFWARKGPYLEYIGPEESWGGIFDRFLAGGILLSPEWNIPSIIPLEMSDHEKKAFAAIMKKGGV